MSIVDVEGGGVTELTIQADASDDPDALGPSGVEFASWGATGRIAFGGGVRWR